MHVFMFLVAGIAGQLLASGVSSWYNEPGIMANGHRFNPKAHVCAMRHVPLGTKVLIVNEDNHNTARCIIGDRGPYIQGRVIDVSPVVRDELGMGGLAPVRVYRDLGNAPAPRRLPQPVTYPFRAP